MIYAIGKDVINVPWIIIVAVVLFILMVELNKSKKPPKHGSTYTSTHTSEFHEWDPLDPTDGYNDCPDCGSGDTDGNHCYDCDEDF